MEGIEALLSAPFTWVVIGVLVIMSVVGFISE